MNPKANFDQKEYVDEAADFVKKNKTRLEDAALKEAPSKVITLYLGAVKLFGLLSTHAISLFSALRAKYPKDTDMHKSYEKGVKHGKGFEPYYHSQDKEKKTKYAYRTGRHEGENNFK